MTPCQHKVCNRNQPASGEWWCYLAAAPAPAPLDYGTHTCHCGTWTQGGVVGFAAHQRVVGCGQQQAEGVFVRRR